MALPKFALQMILKPMTAMALQAYQQGKKDSEEGTYNEKDFEKQLKELIKKQF